ncbi:ABC transporter substrate-binding protein [Micromonospora avicenniae]|uniref:ABC transporter substrate-binding protein n=1 Tax=Micromonospora avicenniae TaxID=1198245 RepID=UPI003447A07C
MRRLRAPLLGAAVAATLAVTGCGVGSGDSGGSSDNMTMTVWTTNPDQLKLLNDLTAEFSKTHGGGKVEIQSIPQADYLTKISIRLSGGTPPDLGWMGAPDAVGMAKNGQLVDLGPQLKDDASYQFDDFVPASFTNWQSGDQVWGVPFSTSPFFTIYNKDLLAKAGAQDPAKLAASGDWTWQTLSDLGRKVQPTLPTGSYAFQSNDGGIYGKLVWTTLEPLIRAYGGKVFDPDTGQCQLNSPQSVAAVQAYRAMAFTDKTAVPPGNEADFFAGKAAVTFTQTSRLSQLKGAGFDWGVAPLPAGPGGPVNFTGQAGLVAFKGGKHEKLATELLKYISGKEGTEKLASFFPPARKSVLAEAEQIYAQGPLPKDAINSVLVSGIEKGYPFRYPSAWPEVLQTSAPVFDKLWAQNANAQDVMNDLCQQLDPLLKRDVAGS